VVVRRLGKRAGRRAAGLVALLVLLFAPPVRAQGALSALQTEVKQIADRAGPCIVTIFAQSTDVRARPAGGPPVRRPHTRMGSGVAVDESFVLTTASVVLGAERIVVRTINGLQVEARLKGVDLLFNVALLHVPELRLPALTLARRPARVGDWVMALGTSYGAELTQSEGRVEAIYSEPRSSLLQLGNPVRPGNSGGAALNTRGELVGLIQGELGAPDPGATGSAAYRPTGASLAMPIEQAKAVYESLRRYGRLPHGHLGVSTRAEVVQSDVDNATVPLGARVESVQPGGPAARLGLRRGDLIVAFDSVQVWYPEQLARWVAQTRPGAVVDLVWVHGEVQHRGRVGLGESRDSLPAWALPPRRPNSEDSARMADIERRIQALGRELDRLKARSR